MERTESGARNGGAAPYRFGDIVVDPAAHTLLRAGVPQPVEPKAFAVLLALLQRPGELIGRDDLLDQVWGHRHVTPGVLTRVIAQLRHALDEDPQQPRYIQTRHALGYSFIGQLEDLTGAAAAAAPVEGGESPAAVVPPRAEAAVEFAPPRATVPLQATLPVWSAEKPAAPVRAKPGRWSTLGAIALLAGLAAWLLIQRHVPPPRPVAASVAVLPFVNLSGRPGDDYFAEGLAEEMRDALAGVRGLKVAASVSPAASRDAADARALGDRLGVASILSASVRREGARLRITARLTDTATGFTLWSHTYDRELSGVFDTQSDIAEEVVHALLGAIPGDSALSKRLTATRSEAAFDTYLQGMQLLRHPDQPDAADQAIARFGQALKQDRGFAKAQAGICRAESWRFQSQRSPTALDNAKAACQQAEQMDPGAPEVDQALGDLYRAAGDPERALQHYRKSAQAPGQAVNAHVGMAKVYAAQGHGELALAEFQQALKLRPEAAFIHAEIGYQQYLDGKLPLAVASYRRAVELDPKNAELWGTLGGLYVEAGNDAAAAPALEHAIAISPAADTLTNLGLLRYRHGDYAGAVVLQRQATTLTPDDFMIWSNLGMALRADPESRPAEIRKTFEEAAWRAQNYLQVKPDDARAAAELGLYRAILGNPAEARRLALRAEALGGQPADVAMLDAETFALLGDLDQARQRLLAARAAGIPEALIGGNHTFRRLGLLSPPTAAGRPAGTEPPAPHSSAGHSTGG
ncbi:hypothetical protein RHOFW104T7_04670 [Rhodanobacter thiooxydans]|uniref:OmpR/PhoB-type domain-containing protein n=1 Tax=Rhodanobacter thiooxydans TaxID=416169 RepID=A0A154QLV0_9GAMM|nr:tetratricopeptide repeat protein [Rhodanobacter thiooxydans]EIM00175.1 protein kinase [Rhodanobacter thiooxydans LCS2]KZC25234.1 hypothetical protein RHOFW104T7_04670 [Rhodanobacter thiooxydans]MCW0203019.1 tetratricopeptide repeat protein [Rhodanobacter thiooxydans]